MRRFQTFYLLVLSPTSEIVEVQGVPLANLQGLPKVETRFAKGCDKVCQSLRLIHASITPQKKPGLPGFK
jgi:hypothetical protein